MEKRMSSKKPNSRYYNSELDRFFRSENISINWFHTLLSFYQVAHTYPGGAPEKISIYPIIKIFPFNIRTQWKRMLLLCI